MPAVAWATVIIAVLIIAITAVGLLRVILHLRHVHTTLGALLGGVRAVADRTTTVPTVVASVNTNLAPVRAWTETVVMVPYGWTLGLVIGLIVVVAVVALVTPILVLAYKIGTQARELDAALAQARENTAGLAGLATTIEHATEIIGGLQRGRARLGADVLTDGEITYWTVILVLGAVVIVAVVVLLSLLVAFVKRIDAGVNAIAGTLTAITENTADTKLITATGDGLELVLAEGLQHHLFLGRVVGKV